MKRAAPPSPPQDRIAIALPARDTVRAGFEHRCIEAQYAWTSFLIAHLVACRKRIGDLAAKGGSSRRWMADAP